MYKWVLITEQWGPGVAEVTPIGVLLNFLTPIPNVLKPAKIPLKGPLSQPHIHFCLHTRVWFKNNRSMSKQRKSLLSY